jgi:glutamine synthetase
MIARASAHDLEVMAAFEPEWTLVVPGEHGGEPFDRSLCFSSQGMQGPAAVIDDIVGALESQDVPVEQYYPELGWGQQELSVRHAPALRAADRHILYRETVRGVAQQHGLAVSFAPKPWPDQPGNGCHLHFSAWDPTGANRFAGPREPYGLSEQGRHFLAGVLDHLPALLALTCASVNSYRRLQPQMWASAYRAWGPDNREAALRVASTFWGQESESANVELKACDSSANPYLALGGVIAAGLDGIDRALEPPAPVTVDPHALSEAQRAAVGATRHPGSLGEAIARLREDPVLMDALGDRLATSYIAVKESDIDGFGAEEDSFEFSNHRFRY